MTPTSPRTTQTQSGVDPFAPEPGARWAPTTLCALCRHVTWNGDLCKACERVAGA